MPAECTQRWDIPLFLGFQHKEGAGYDKAATADNLRHPVDAISEAGRHFIYDAGKSCEPRYLNGKCVRSGLPKGGDETRTQKMVAPNIWAEHAINPISRK